MSSEKKLVTRLFVYLVVLPGLTLSVLSYLISSKSANQEPPTATPVVIEKPIKILATRSLLRDRSFAVTSLGAGKGGELELTDFGIAIPFDNDRINVNYVNDNGLSESVIHLLDPGTPANSLSVQVVNASSVAEFKKNNSFTEGWSEERGSTLLAGGTMIATPYGEYHFKQDTKKQILLIISTQKDYQTNTLTDGVANSIRGVRIVKNGISLYNW